LWRFYVFLFLFERFLHLCSKVGLRYHALPHGGRSYRDHRFCDVTALYAYFAEQLEIAADLSLCPAHLAVYMWRACKRRQLGLTERRRTDECVERLGYDLRAQPNRDIHLESSDARRPAALLLPPRVHKNYFWVRIFVSFPVFQRRRLLPNVAHTNRMSVVLNIFWVNYGGDQPSDGPSTKCDAVVFWCAATHILLAWTTRIPVIFASKYVSSLDYHRTHLISMPAIIPPRRLQRESPNFVCR